MSTITSIEVNVRPEVRRGAALLDELNPGWDEHVNLAELDMNYCDKCIVGQVYMCGAWGRMAYRDYRDRLDELGLYESREETEYGFHVDTDDDEEWAKLAEEWRDLIASRR